MGAVRPDALLEGILKRLSPFAKPFMGKDRVKPPTALDCALFWTYQWSYALKKQRETVRPVLR